ncbi:MAG: tetraacyldisaccharide 4'-kinase [Chitinophagaceae bacterium]|nr:tetraacyldisaccharide 4'-kinase [Chitinophagaceae bacterium]
MIKQVLRYLLLPFTLLYGAIVWLRNRLYDSGFISSVSFDIPLIAFGNLSVGGTGKTPHIEYLVRLLQYEYKVATMSRGYKRHTRGFMLADAETNALKIGDEPMQYFMKFPELAVSVAEDRMTGIPSLLMARPETEIVLLDDAYQHRSVKAGLNILITDFASPFYEDYILPYGRLREGRGAYNRADIIVVSKCPQNLSNEDAEKIKAKINPLAHQKVFFSFIKYGAPYLLGNQNEASFAQKKVVLISGIAKPEPLVAYLKQRAEQVHLLDYPDHHFFTERNFEEIKDTLKNWDHDCVIVTTEKDATRLFLHKKKLKEIPVPIIVLPIEVHFLLGQQNEFDAAVRSFVGEQYEKFIAE